MTSTNKPEDWFSRLAAVERDLRELRAKVGLTSARISDGTLTVDGGEFVVQHLNGQLLLAVQRQDDGKYTIILRRHDGSKVLELGTTTTGNQYWALHDRGNRIIVSDDTASAWGLADPKIVGTLYPAYNKILVGTTSAAYERLWEGELPAANPLMRTAWTISITGPAGTSGNVQVLYDDAVVLTGATVTDASAIQLVIADATQNGNRAYGDLINIKIQARRTAGTGTVYVTPLGTYGAQSP